MFENDLKVLITLSYREHDETHECYTLQFLLLTIFELEFNSFYAIAHTSGITTTVLEFI